MRGILFLILLSSICLGACKQSEKPTNLIGGRYEKHGEVLCYDNYWLEGYRDTVNDHYKVFLVDRSANSPVVDSLDIIPGSANETIDYGTVISKDVQDRSLVVLYMTSDSCFSKSIRKAWKANTEKGKFEDHSGAGLEVQQVKNCQ
jgi:hypothetical protein